jgi:Ca2+-binding RTX toxin-like protein
LHRTGGRYALAELSPIAVQGRSYDAHAARLALFDPATESGVLTEGWPADRARFLAWKVYANTRDTASVFGYTENQEKWSYRDLARPDEGLTVLPAGLPSPQGAPEHLVVFGSDTADAAIVGGARSDRLYGMGGADTLSGGAGADYLEGNAATASTAVPATAGQRADDDVLWGRGRHALDGAGDDTPRRRRFRSPPGRRTATSFAAVPAGTPDGGASDDFDQWRMPICFAAARGSTPTFTPDGADVVADVG